jgi:tetratricopeptide (TPR) repeat protein
MKRFLIHLILLLASAANVFSQSALKSNNPLQAQFDSLLVINRTDYLTGKLGSIPASNARLLQLAEKLRVDSTFVWAYASISNYFSSKADYSSSLEYNFKAIPIANRGFKRASAFLYGNVANTYRKLGNYDAALQYLHYAQQHWNDALVPRSGIPNLLAMVYVDRKKPDSALKYVQLAYQVNVEEARLNAKDPIIKSNINLSKAQIYTTFGRVYEMLHEPDLVNDYYRKSIRFSDSLNIVTSASTAALYGTYLLRQKKYDEAKNYGVKSFNIACRDYIKTTVVGASALLYNLYKLQNNKDSAYYYLEVKNLYQDSVAAEEKANQLQGLIIKQQLKDAELQAKATQDAEQRHRNIEYAIIAFGLVVLVTLFLLVSRSIIVNPRVIEVTGVMGLLILFEFINLVIHPYIAEFTNDSPLLMLLILVAIAAIIVPLHHRLEHWVKHKLVEKNKTIRLEAAKRTIEQLGGRPKSEV